MNVVRHLFLLVFLIQQAYSYRLNVPRVLLPYHPTVPVVYELEVSQPVGGCFHWRSTRPDVVSVTPLGVKPGECSDKAVIRATAKSLVGELSAVIFAEDRASSTTLSCGVSVDHVSEIRIETTTKVLFVDAAPVRMVVEGFNKEGDRFSTLSSIAVDWELKHNGKDRPFRIVPFEQSSYESPPEIVNLEKQKKKGYMILLEGVVTGSAILSAKFSDSYLSKIPAHDLDLTVVANLLLNPSYDLYVPVHSHVSFEVLIVKQHSTEVIGMPSDVYYLSLDDKAICSLDVPSSSIYAEKKGKTEIHLLSRNVDVKAKTGVRPPSTVINVVDPETLHWVVSGENWVLQTNTPYTLSITLSDTHGNSMYIGDNFRFESIVSSEFFKIEHSTKNQSHFVVTPIKVGGTTLNSKFIAIIGKDGTEYKVSGKVRGEQSLQIVDPVRVSPRDVFLPYFPRLKINYPLNASGGSGAYDWSSDDTSVCGVDVSSGVISSGSLGKAVVSVQDKRNPALLDTADVSILDVFSLSFGRTVKEAEVGKTLYLNVQLFGSGSNGPVAFTDCRGIQWNVKSANNKIFEPVSGKTNKLPSVGTGCDTIALKSVASGDTKITISFEHLSASVDVSAFSPLELSSAKVALALGSDFEVRLSGGPRPWVLEPTHHFRTADDSSRVSVKILEDMAQVQCHRDPFSMKVKIRVGNEASETLPLPVVSEIFMPICCATPTRLSIFPQRSSTLKCPSQSLVILTSGDLQLGVSGYGTCDSSETLLDSMNRVVVKWSADNSKLVNIDSDSDGSLAPIVHARGLVGKTVVYAKASSISGEHKMTVPALKGEINLRVVEKPQPSPSSLVIWNEAIAKSEVVVSGGSGHFSIIQSSPHFTASSQNGKLLVNPRSQGKGIFQVVDLCLVDESFDISVRVSDIHALSIHGAKYVEVGSLIDIFVLPTDETGASFSEFHGALADSTLDFNNGNLQIMKHEGNRYSLRAVSVGFVSLSASAKSSSGRVLNSLPYQVQVFSPISLYPKRVTLIPESTFQLEVLGGPNPLPPITFALNNSKIASIEPNGLITSSNLGYTSITGSISVAGDHLVKDMVVLHVVSLHGIKLVSSSHGIETGGSVWVQIQGLDDQESPFSFGGANYPFTVKWSVSHPEILKRSHPLGQSYDEEKENQFGIWLNGSASGTAVVKAVVELSSKAKQHFVKSHKVFEAEVDIRVNPALAISRPEVPNGVLRVAPNTKIQLESAWASSAVEYSVPPHYSNLMSVTSSGYLRTHAKEGNGVVSLRLNTPSDNMTVLVPVSIRPVHSIDLVSVTSLNTRDDEKIVALPVGVMLKLNVLFRDSRGLFLHTSGSTISYRPHRFDLTEISGNTDNTTITVTMKSAGETVLKVWDTQNPSTAVFLRLSAREELVASGPNAYSVFDVICLHSPLSGVNHWSTSGNGIQWLDASLGVAKLTKAGSEHVTVKTDTQSLHANIHISQPSGLVFEDIPSVISNFETSKYVYTLQQKTNNSRKKQECSDAQLEVLKLLPAPVECSISFTSGNLPPAINLLSVKSVYHKSSGFSCVVEPLSTGGVSQLNVMGAKEANLVVKARFSNGFEAEEAVTKSIFHLGMNVVDSEIQLSNVGQTSTIVSVAIPSYQTRYLSVVGCQGDAISVTEISDPNPENMAANKFYRVKLNLRKAVVWSDISKNCAVTIENQLTGQVVSIPVHVRLVGNNREVFDAAEADGFIEFCLYLIQYYSSWIPSLMAICLLAILAIGGYWYLSRRWERTGNFGNESQQSSMFSMNDTHRVQSFQDSSTLFRNSPLFKSTPINDTPLPGRKGAMWTNTSPNRM